jgi:hypothetical protein
MRKYVILLLYLCILTTNAHAFDLIGIEPDKSFFEAIGVDTEADKAYLRGIAEGYQDRYVVTEEPYIDIYSIDYFYNQLSAPLTLTEIDNGKTELDTSFIVNEDYRKQMNFLKLCGGFAGYSAEFEPIAYFSVYRNIALIGGYVRYQKAFENPDDAYWQYICGMENLTKEVIPYDTRLRFLDKIRSLSEFMAHDRTFKIFILKDGKIDSLWERGNGI